MISFIKSYPFVLLLAYIAIINVCLFFMMAIDKRKARKGVRRIPEARLFLLAVLGGSLGGICGIYCFRHKTKHKSFTIGFPLIMLAQLAAAAMILFI